LKPPCVKTFDKSKVLWKTILSQNEHLLQVDIQDKYHQASDLKAKQMPSRYTDAIVSSLHILKKQGLDNDNRMEAEEEAPIEPQLNHTGPMCIDTDEATFGRPPKNELPMDQLPPLNRMGCRPRTFFHHMRHVDYSFESFRKMSAFLSEYLPAEQDRCRAFELLGSMQSDVLLLQNNLNNLKVSMNSNFLCIKGQEYAPPSSGFWSVAKVEKAKDQGEPVESKTSFYR